MSSERVLAIYDKAFMAYNDARQHLRDEMTTASSTSGSSDSTSRILEIKLADRALATILLERTPSVTSFRRFRRGKALR